MSLDTDPNSMGNGPRWAQGYARFMEYVTQFTKYALVIIVTIMCILVFGQVVTRYVIHNTPPFMGELATYGLMWTAMLGSSLAFRNGKHVAVEILIEKLNPKNQRMVSIINKIILVAFLVVFLIASFGFALSMWRQTSTTMNIRMTYPALGFPIGTLLMILQVIDVFLKKGGE